MINRIGVVFLIVLLSGCMLPNQIVSKGTALDLIHKDLANAEKANHDVKRKSTIARPLNHWLIPMADDLTSASQQSYERHFDLSAHHVPAKTFFMSLVKDTPYSVVIDPKVEGTISLTLKNVTLDEVLQSLRDIYGYDFRVKPYGFDVLPAGVRTQLFNVNYLNMSRKGTTETTINSGQLTKGSNTRNPSNTSTDPTNPNASVYSPNSNHVSTATSVVMTASESNFWKELTTTLHALLAHKPKASVIVQAEAGLVIVRADPTTLREVQYYLETIQANMRREVVLEAKIIEVELNDGFQTGINWQLLGFQQGNDLTNHSASGFTNLLKLHITAGNTFSAFIKMLSEQGNVQVLSSPHISTMNNQKAVIKVGRDEYFVTGLTNSTLAAGNSSDTSQNVNLQPFFSGIALDVTPQIDEKGEVILHIHPSVSEIEQQEKVVTVGSNDVTLPSALNKVRESDTIVRAKNGQVIIIGGLMETKTSELLKGAPFLSKMPFIGTLFRNTNQQYKKTELVILLRPLLVGVDTWHNELKRLKNRYAGLKRGFHFGDKPHIFGNAAENPSNYRSVLFRD